jgi:hypothetical protein
MSPSSLDSPADSSLQSPPSASPALGDAHAADRDATRSRCTRASAPETVSGKPSPEPPAVASRMQTERPAPRLLLDPRAVADVDGLAEEVALLRASIRQLASGDEDVAVQIKVLAELRHQIEALGRALKTQRSLEGRDGGGQAAEMDRMLEELGDDLGVER